MKYIKMGVWGFLFSVLGACSTASGPIKAYDESAGIDPGRLARIYLPPEIDLLEVDGVEKDSPFIEQGLNEIQLLPGKHEITIKYQKYWGSEVSGSMVSSDPVTFHLDIGASESYTLKFPVVKDIWGATSMAAKFKPWLEDKKGTRLAVKQVKSGVISLRSPATATMSAEEIVSRQKPLEKLQFWWKLADKKDRKAFRRWIVEN